jgi:hypothetical protein
MAIHELKHNPENDGEKRTLYYTYRALHELVNKYIPTNALHCFYDFSTYICFGTFVPSSGLPSKVHNPNASGSLSQYVTPASYHHCTSLFVVIDSSSFMLLKLNH